VRASALALALARAVSVAVRLPDAGLVSTAAGARDAAVESSPSLEQHTGPADPAVEVRLKRGCRPRRTY
jgi:hypothetical protein